MMSGDAKARVIVVTGGGSGIGRAVVLACARRGDSVAVFDKNGASAKLAAEEARKAGAGSAIGLECDVASEEQVMQALAASTEQLGAPYGLFANAGIDTGGPIHDLPLATWSLVIETNLTGV